MSRVETVACLESFDISGIYFEGSFCQRQGAFILVFVAFGDTTLSLAVALAVLIGGSVSAVVGFALPWAFKWLGSDPAMGSGPICTIIQDVASLSIYFMLVTALMV